MSKNVEVYLEIKNDKTDFLPELLKITWAAPNNIGAMDYISDFKKPFYAKKVNFDDLKATLNNLYDKNHDDDGLRYSRDFLEFERRWT